MNPVPFQLALVTVTLELPALSVPGWLWLDPTVTFPNVIVAGLMARPPWVMPVPERDTAMVGSDAVLTTETVPLAAPPADGWKLTFKLRL